MYYSTTQYDMIWYDNSNIDFKWNISKIMALTLIVKISFQVSKSLLFLLFLQNRKNFNYSQHMAHKHFRRTSTFFFLIFWILLHCWYEHFFTFAFTFAFALSIFHWFNHFLLIYSFIKLLFSYAYVTHTIFIYFFFLIALSPLLCFLPSLPFFPSLVFSSH